MGSEARPSSTTSTFAALLRQHRTAAALSQEALAERAGLSARAISDLERGAKTRPYLETVRMLADALDLTLPERTELARAARPQASPFPSERPDGTVSGLRGVIPLAAQTSLIGRSDDIALIASFLRRDDVHLVTLVGPGGVGKTRLALAVARAVQSEFPDGVWFIDLTSVSDPKLVPSAIVQALGLSEAGGTPLIDQLVAFLGGKRILLVLDNFEHVVDAASAIADLVGRQPSVKLLVTSRMPLHISGEQEVPIEPLLLPDEGAAQIAEVRDIAAVELFVQRAQAARPSFSLTDENASAVAGVCRRLDGLPLAIELAAARIKLMSPQSLLERLEHALPLLTSGPIDRPDRHRALHATIAWSYDLLDETERTLFRRLSVFRGGCTIESAEAVCNFDNSLDILGGIASLVDKSLLRCEGDEPRFRMLETIREFASENVECSFESQQLSERHAEHLISFCRETEAQLSGPEAAAWIGRLDRDMSNAREAMQWLIEREDPRALQLTNALETYWWLTSQVREGASWLARAVALDSSADFLSLRAKCLLGLGRLTVDLGDFRGARSALQEAEAYAMTHDEPALLAQSKVRLGIVELIGGSVALENDLLAEGLALCEQVGDKSGVALALIYMADACMLTADFAQAEVLARQSLAILRSLADQFGVLISLSVLGTVLCERGSLSEAMALFTEVSESWLKVGIPSRATDPLMNLAYATYLTGDMDTAADYAERAIFELRSNGRIRVLPYVLSTLGCAAAAKRDFDVASRAFREALALASKFGDEYIVAEIIEAIGVELVALCDYPKAVQLFASATKRLSSLGASRLQSKKRIYDESVRRVKFHLTECEYTANWELGSALSMLDSTHMADELATSLATYVTA